MNGIQNYKKKKERVYQIIKVKPKEALPRGNSGCSSDDFEDEEDSMTNRLNDLSLLVSIVEDRACSSLISLPSGTGDSGPSAMDVEN